MTRTRDSNQQEERIFQDARSSKGVWCHQTVKAPSDVMRREVGEPRFGVG